MREGLVDGSALQLVTVCVSADEMLRALPSIRLYRPAGELVLDCRRVEAAHGDDGAVGISDELGEPVAPAPPAVSHLRRSEARELAFCLLELAELADRRSQEPR